MTEHEAYQSPEEKSSRMDDVNQNKPGISTTPYPNLEKSEGADNEQFIINNSNGNGINPNPQESGNKPEWIDGRRQNEEYIDDASKEKKED